MRLQYIKLAGFKSFVDATKVPFPDQMTCVVGPNGCGKSNVIDAVRWVLGESSAKNLRGDAMTDVIFNGSSARKPVSRASVELVFDNSEGRLQGEFANYNDISVKRVVTRDAQSTYFLNGNKCRRRDITDLFLGTGLGPRSYAIIEQGMISRLIESKPQELRVFIEEAAGISKYKERRKETESRMRKTHENLERLTDVREELGTQLAKLQRQAAAAQRYKALKAEERTHKAQLQALKWSQYQRQCDRLEAQLNQQQTELERWVAEQRGSERGQTELREQQQDLKAKLDHAQQQFYQCNTDITRLEQGIQHQQQLAEQRRKELDELQLQRQQVIDEQEQEHSERAQLLEQQQAMAPEIAMQRAQLESLQDDISDAQARKMTLSDRHQAALQDSQAQRQQAAVLTTQLEAIAAALDDLQRQYDGYQQKRTQLEGSQTAAEHAEQLARVETYQQLHDEAEAQLESAQAEQERHYEALQHSQTQLQRSQSEHQHAQQQVASYQQLLDSLEQQQDPQLEAWLANHAWQPLRTLLTVKPAWQGAVEAIAGPWLNAPVVTASTEVDVFNVPGNFGKLLQVGASTSVAQRATVLTLDRVIDGPAAQLGLFQQVACVESGAEARTVFNDSDIAMAVTPEGRIFTRDGWQQSDGQASQVLAWQQALEQYRARLPELDEQLVTAQQQREQAQQAYSISKDAVAQYQQAAMDASRQLAQGNARLDGLARQQRDEQERMSEITAQIEQLQQRQAEQQQAHANFSEQLDELTAALADTSPVQSQLAQQLQELETELQGLHAQHQQRVQQSHQLQLRQQQIEQAIAHASRSIERACQRLEQLDARRRELTNQGTEVDTELERAQLEEALLRREDAEQQKNTLADALAAVEEQLAVLNQGQHGIQQRIDEQRSQVEASKMELIAARERGHSLLEGLQETGYSLKQVLETMPEEAEQQQWQQRLDKIGRSLQQLGAINLAAIEEAEAQGQRKAYLDAQHNDLTESLALLEDAIKKIDKETRQRFRKTFDQVNHDLGQLFPKVFGGGSAYLALTDDDLLETGVTIMARPPGKKNSTIHLLSGGEKALTALSLVFAIFRLNPAPFCLLDEVDAPLDDANVGRFCRLVQEMSESVQFIYISHNKIAMEMATHLAGVTMQEPGVSRLVTVDVDEAVAMAEAS